MENKRQRKNRNKKSPIISNAVSPVKASPLKVQESKRETKMRIKTPSPRKNLRKMRCPEKVHIYSY